MQITLDEVVAQLTNAAGAGRLVVFCGAGISFNSGVPTVNAFKRRFIEVLNLPEEERIKIESLKWPFEALIEALSGLTSIDAILDIFDAKEPNANHLLLAKLAQHNLIRTICTTNFDRLIETAVEDLPVPPVAPELRIYHQTDRVVTGVTVPPIADHFFDQINWQSNESGGQEAYARPILQLIKIHGSIEDRGNIAITLREVASKTLVESRQRVIRHLFSMGPSVTMLILGYSCSDLFDITQEIEKVEASTATKVIYIGHIDEQFTALELAPRPLRYAGEALWIACDTNRLVERLWKALLSEPFPQSRATMQSSPWEDHIRRWDAEEFFGPRGAMTKCRLLAYIFFQMADWEASAKYEKAANDIAEKCGDVACMLSARGNLATVMWAMGEYEESIRLHKDLVSEALANGATSVAQNALCNLGNAYREREEHNEAEDAYNRALKMAQEPGGIRSQEGPILGNLASLRYSQGDFEAATNVYEQALEASRIAGNKRDEAMDLTNLGSAVAGKGDHTRAADYHTQSLELARQLGDNLVEGTALDNLGTAYGRLGYRHRALYCHELAADRKSNTQLGIATSLANLGNAHSSLGNWAVAADCYGRALAVYDRILGDRAHSHPSVLLVRRNLRLLSRDSGVERNSIPQSIRLVWAAMRAAALVQNLDGLVSDVEAFLNDVASIWDGSAIQRILSESKGAYWSKFALYELLVQQGIGHNARIASSSVGGATHDLRGQAELARPLETIAIVILIHGSGAMRVGSLRDIAPSLPDLFTMGREPLYRVAFEDNADLLPPERRGDATIWVRSASVVSCLAARFLRSRADVFEYLTNQDWPFSNRDWWETLTFYIGSIPDEPGRTSLLRRILESCGHSIDRTWFAFGVIARIEVAKDLQQEIIRRALAEFEGFRYSQESIGLVATFRNRLLSGDVAYGLAKLVYPPYLREALHDQERWKYVYGMRGAVSLALGKLYTPKDLEGKLAVLLRDSMPNIRTAACLTLGQIGGLPRSREYVGMLSQHLCDEEGRAAALAIYGLADSESLPDIQRLLFGEGIGDEVVKRVLDYACKKAMGSSGDIDYRWLRELGEEVQAELLQLSSQSMKSPDRAVERSGFLDQASNKLLSVLGSL